jgi:hypothetical protein
MKGSMSARIVACAVLSIAAGVAAAAPPTTATTAPAALAAPAAAPKATVPKPSTANAPVDLSGSWSGSIDQVGRQKSYRLDIALTGKTGQTDYPDQNCTGKLTRVAVSGDYAFFTETIIRGKFDAATKAGCLDGSMTIQRDSDGIVMAWMTTYAGRPIVAYGSLMAKKK